MAGVFLGARGLPAQCQQNSARPILSSTNTLRILSMPFIDHYESLSFAAALLDAADGLLITAGAGLGVDSGLPDFRGDDGFWKAYPPLASAGIRFVEIASPASFERTPELAWGFYGHRLQLYRDTVPHEGYAILREIAAQKDHGAFVFTSNVDGQFQKAGFEPNRIVECHGSLHHLQCSRPCAPAIWPATALSPVVDLATCQMTSPMPTCPTCGRLARPNVLMFNDSEWASDRTDLQRFRLDRWLSVVRRLVVIELGAGTAIPSVRRMGEHLGAPLIRVNPRESAVSHANQVALPFGALEGLRRLQARLAG